MKGLDNGPVEPSGFGRQERRLLREFTKGVLVLLRPATVNGHRLLKARIVRGDEEALLSGDDEDLVSDIEMETISQVLGDGGTDGATHLTERDSAGHRYLGGAEG